MTTPVDYCPSILADQSNYRALGQAAGASVDAASQSIESARQAATQTACQAQLGQAVSWLRWAQNTYGGDNYWADRCACAASQLTDYAAAVPSDPAQLAAWQLANLLPFQGIMAQLSSDAANWGPVQDSAFEGTVLLVAGLVVLFLGGWAESRPVRRGVNR